MSKSSTLFSPLFWKISGVFLLVLVLFGAIALYVAVDGARMYEQEVSQRLNHDLAEHTVKEIKPWLEGEIQEEAHRNPHAFHDGHQPKCGGLPSGSGREAY